MANRLSIGVDFGGSSSKATLIDETGKVLATASREYLSYYPHPGWVEQNPKELYEAFVLNVQELLKKSGVDPEDIVVLAVDAATHMAVFVDENDEPLYNIIHWSDSRAVEEVKFVKENYDDLLAAHSYNYVSTGWNLPQILWLRKHEPEMMAKVRRIYFAKDYIRHCVTGDFCTDYIEAMGALLSDDKTATWNKELCDLAGISIDMLPEIKAPSDIVGNVSAKAAAETGLSTKTQVIVGTTDTALEVYASGAVSNGVATLKLATAGRICPITDGPLGNRHFFNYKHLVPGKWYPGTGTRSCATSYKWFRNSLGDLQIIQAKETGKDPYNIFNEMAAKVPAGSEGLIYHPYLLGEMTPLFDDKVRASFTGVSIVHNKGHFARAVMEGVAYSMKDSMLEIEKENIHVDQLRIIGGGAKSPLWAQIVADVLDTPLYRTENNDSSLGSAMLGGVAVGLFKDYADSVEKCVKVSGYIEPIPENVEAYKKGFKMYKAIQAAMQPVYDEFF